MSKLSLFGLIFFISILILGIVLLCIGLAHNNKDESDTRNWNKYKAVGGVLMGIGVIGTFITAYFVYSDKSKSKKRTTSF
jgi:hypothetical protein